MAPLSKKKDSSSSEEESSPGDPIEQRRDGVGEERKLQQADSSTVHVQPDVECEQQATKIRDEVFKLSKAFQDHKEPPDQMNQFVDAEEEGGREGEMACTAVVRPVDDPNEYLPHLPSSDSNIVSSTVPLGPFDDLENETDCINPAEEMAPNFNALFKSDDEIANFVEPVQEGKEEHPSMQIPRPRYSLYHLTDSDDEPQKPESDNEACFLKEEEGNPHECDLNTKRPALQHLMDPVFDTRLICRSSNREDEGYSLMPVATIQRAQSMPNVSFRSTNVEIDSHMLPRGKLLVENT